MRGLLVVASFWANAEPALPTHPIGPWLKSRTSSLMSQVTDLRTQLDRWAESHQDVVFDIEIFSLEDEAAVEIRSLAALPEKSTHAAMVISADKAKPVQELLPHILAAEHARRDAQHTVNAVVGRPGIAVPYVKMPVTTVDANGVARTSLRTIQLGDHFFLQPDKVTFDRTDFTINITPSLSGIPNLATSRLHYEGFAAWAKITLGESLVVFRRPLERRPSANVGKALPAAGIHPALEHTPAMLYIITPRRGPRTLAPPPAARPALKLTR